MGCLSGDTSRKRMTGWLARRLVLASCLFTTRQLPSDCLMAGYLLAWPGCLLAEKLSGRFWLAAGCCCVSAVWLSGYGVKYCFLLLLADGRRTV